MDLHYKIQQLINNLNDKMEENISKVESQFLNEYGWPEFDPLREEITKCLICDFCQAAITLTNHLLENFLKTMLIYKDPKGIDKNQDLRTAYKNGIETYSDWDLYKTIRKSKAFGIITKAEAIVLDKFREDFRNAYSHADKNKIFKDLKVKISFVGLNENHEYGDVKQTEEKLSDLPFAQGIAQDKLSKKDSFGYFITIDKIIRNSLNKYGQAKSLIVND